jgi:electron transfer flavoprotein alpha subunit
VAGPIWVFAEIGDDSAREVVFELLTKARSLGGTVEAVALGQGGGQAVAQLGKFGAAKVYLSEEALYSQVLATAAVDTLASLIGQHRPSLVLFGMTYDGRDIASRLSARLGVPLIANATDVVGRDGAWAVVTPVFGGSTLVTTKTRGSGPAIVLVRPKAFAAEPANGNSPAVEQISQKPESKSRAARIIKREKEASSGPKLEDAAIIVSGGRGLGGPENFKLVDDLAAALGAAVGASRAVVDAGWKPYAFQIGQTGKTVKPTVYIAVGISGAMQHTVGMKGAKTIIAINKDPEAPIFKLADLGVVGDVHKVVPQLTAEIKKRKGK